MWEGLLEGISTLETVTFSALLLSLLSTLLVLSVKGYRRLRRRIPVQVNCWFCNEDCKVPWPLDKEGWTCPHCLQYNGFNTDGDYNKRIPAMFIESLNKPATALKMKMISTKSPADSLCDKCNANQELKNFQLGQFVPSNEDKFDEEVEVERQRLEAIYDICNPCKKTVQRVLRKGTNGKENKGVGVTVNRVERPKRSKTPLPMAYRATPTLAMTTTTPTPTTSAKSGMFGFGRKSFIGSTVFQRSNGVFGPTATPTATPTHSFLDNSDLISINNLRISNFPLSSTRSYSPPATATFISPSYQQQQAYRSSGVASVFGGRPLLSPPRLAYHSHSNSNGYSYQGYQPYQQYQQMSLGVGVGMSYPASLSSCHGCCCGNGHGNMQYSRTSSQTSGFVTLTSTPTPTPTPPTPTPTPVNRNPTVAKRKIRHLSHLSSEEEQVEEKVSLLRRRRKQFSPEKSEIQKEKKPKESWNFPFAVNSFLRSFLFVNSFLFLLCYCFVGVWPEPLRPLSQSVRDFYSSFLFTPVVKGVEFLLNTCVFGLIIPNSDNDNDSSSNLEANLFSN